jgi:hypothetical protein
MSWAADIIDSLASLPGFPPAREQTARSLLARRLEMVLGWREGAPMPAAAVSELLAEMLELDKWPGPASFFAIARRVSRPARDDYHSADVAHLRDYLPQPANMPDCPTCNGWGYISSPGGAVWVGSGGVAKSSEKVGTSYSRCECWAGRNLGETFLELLNARTEARRGPGGLKRVEQGELSAITAMSRLITAAADVADAVHFERIGEALNDPEFSTGGNP